MLARVLIKQLARDLRASWQKSLALGVLLLVGLIFWVPPLIRAVFGGGAKAAPPAKSAAATTSANASKSASASTSAGAAATAADAPTITAIPWHDADRIARTDPLVRSADVAAIQGNPFRIDHRQFPPPVLFAEDEPVAKVVVPVAAAPAVRTLPTGLVLRSTIVGVNRRAAFINRKLYFEGARVDYEGESYLLAAVFPRKIVLRHGQDEFELTIADPKSPSERSDVPAPLSATNDSIDGSATRDR